MARKEKSAEVQQIAKMIEYRQVFESEQGVRVLYDIMKAGHMLHNSYAKGDSHETAFREGERNMALRILTILKVNPEKLREMIKQGESE